MCVLFSAQQESPLVIRANTNLDLLIKSGIKVELEEDSSTEEQQLQPPNANAKSMMESSPFTADFKAVYHQAQSEVLKEENSQHTH